MSSNILLKMENITKKFQNITALDNVSFHVEKGEVLALMGENGAGKSTLMKVLSGMYPYGSFSGNIYMDNEEVEFHKPKDSESLGISIIYQELELFEDLTVAENIFVGKYPHKKGVINWHEINFQAKKILDEIGVEIDVYLKVKDIGVGKQQLVEIAKALSMNAKLLILDEPTAALTEIEIELLMKILYNLREKGISAIFIAHKLNEIFDIADRVTVLRDGHCVGTDTIEKLDEDKIISMMVGRELSQRYPDRDPHIGETVLELKNFTKYNMQAHKILKDISFSVRSGEIVGISGLMGAGRTELLMSIFGFLQGQSEGNVYLDGEIVNIRSPRDAITLGMGLVSEDRKRLGLVLDQSILVNATLASLDQVSQYGCLDLDKEVHLTNIYTKNTNTKLQSIESDVKTLSGGNQQKVLLSRCLMTKPRILFLDEPTRGIDVGAKYEIYCLMNELAHNGTAIVMVSSEMLEVIGMSDRVLVLFDGEITGEFSGDEITQENIMQRASGGQ